MIRIYSAPPSTGMTLPAPMAHAELLRLAAVVTRMQRLAERARRSGRIDQLSRFHIAASDAAGRALALSRQLPMPKPAERLPDVLQRLREQDESAQRHRDYLARTGQLLKIGGALAPRQATSASEEREGAPGLYVLVTRKVSPENRKTGGSA